MSKKGLTVELEVEKLLDDYKKDLEEEVEKAARGTAAATARYLKKHSPRGRGKRHYADGWRSKRIAKRHYIVKNETKPSLTYLLNNGHRKAGGTDEVKGDGHIDTANEWAVDLFMKKVKDAI